MIIDRRIVFTPFHYRRSRRLRRIFLIFGILFWVTAAMVALIPIAPWVLYRVFPSTPDTLAHTIATTVSASAIATANPLPVPPLDTNLAATPLLVIDKIGVNGAIHEGDDWEEILKQGIWRVPNFGTPEAGKPIILASHRWGYLAWSNAFRRLNSFYNLPKLDIGDKIEIDWGQRHYYYVVSKRETGDAITDYSADLILYTCQLWDSPIRFFIYASRTTES